MYTARFALLAMLIILSFASSRVMAVDKYWNNAAGGDYLGANWEDVGAMPVAPPTSADNAIFGLSNASPYTVTFAANGISDLLTILDDKVILDTGSFDYFIGNRAEFGNSSGENAELTLNNGQVDVYRYTYIANGSGSTAKLSIDGPNSSWQTGLSSDISYVGLSGDGTLEVTSGGQFNSPGRLFLGSSSSASGMVLASGVSGSDRSTLSVDQLAVGIAGSGLLEVENGAFVESTSFTTLGSSAFATDIHVHGQSGGFNATFTTSTLSVRAGSSPGTSTVTVGDGGSIEVSGTASFGNSTSGAATLVVDGGSFSAGTLSFESSGQFDFRDGTVTIDGGTLGLQPSDLELQGNGVTDHVELELVNGATESLSNLYVGGSSSAAGNMGTVRVQSGSTLLATNLKLWGPGTLDLDGGTISTTNFDDAAGTFNWLAGVMRIDNVTIGATGPFGATPTLTDGQIIDGVTAVNIDAGASLTLSGGGILAQTVNNSGTLNFDTGSIELTNSGLTVGVGGLLGSAVSLVNDQSVIVSDVTTIDPGSSLTINGGSLETDSITNNGTFVYTSGGLRLNNSNLTLDSGELLGSTVTLSGDDSLYVSGTTTLQPGATLTLDGGDFSTAALNQVGGSGTLVWNSGDLEIRNSTIRIADSMLPFGDTLDIDGTKSLSVGRLEVGDNVSEGTVNVSGGGSLTTTNHIYLGGLSDDGTLSVDGAGSSVGIGGTLIVGGGINTGGGEGTLSISNGAAVISSFGYLSFFRGNQATATISGAGSSWTMSNDLYVGGLNTSGSGLGTAEMVVSGGATVSNNNAYLSNVSFAFTSDVTVSGAGSQWLNSGEVRIGASGVANVTIGPGATMESGSTTSVFSNGTLNLVGGTLRANRLTNSNGQINWIAGDLDITGTSIFYVGTGITDGPLGNNVDVGAGKNLTVPRLIVRDQISTGTASLDINSGGTTHSQGDIYLNDVNTSYYGEILVEGESSSLSTNTSIYIGGQSSSPRGPALLSVGDGATVSADNLVKVWAQGDVEMDGGTINAQTFELAGGDLSGFGTVNATTMGGSSITAQGGALTIGNAASVAGFAYTGTSQVQADSMLRLLDANAAELGPVTSVQGGVLAANNGIQIDDSDVIFGYGIVVGSVSGSNAPDGLLISTPTGTVDYNGLLDVGNASAVVYSQAQANLGPLTTIDGGSLESNNGLRLADQDTIRGNGTINANVQLVDGVLHSEGGSLNVSGNVSGYGLLVNSVVASSIGSPTGTVLRSAPLDVGTDNYTVLSSGIASLGPATSIAGGSITATNGLYVGGATQLSGTGVVTAPLAADFGSTITAAGNLTLGDPTSVAGFFSDGFLQTGVHTVTINDANEAVLGSLTTLGTGSDGGRLVAGTATPDLTGYNAGLPDDFLLEDGKNVIGRGGIAGNFRNMGSVIGDGTMLSERIEFENGFTVTGIGYAENVLYSGNHSPGLSPAVVTGKNQAFAGTVELELGGTTPGSGSNSHDQIVDLGAVELVEGVDLAIRPWNGFEPAIGDEFEVLTWSDDLAGTFDEVIVDSYFAALGIDFEISYGDDSIILSAVQAGIAGDFDGDGNVDGGDFLAWQRDPGVGDLADWQINYGTSAALSASSSPVPEPATLLQLLTAGAMIGLARWKRD